MTALAASPARSTSDQTHALSHAHLERRIRSQWASIPLLLCLLLCQLGLCAKSLNRSLSGSVDFRVFYASGHLLATGHASSLYDLSEQRQTQNSFVAPNSRTLPFLYPPCAALFYAPFAFLPYKLAFFALTLINLTLLFVVVTWLQRRLNLSEYLPTWLSPRALAWLIPLCLFPVSIALMQGQITVLLLLLYTACFLAFERGCGFLAGVLLAATLIKFQLTLPIALLFLVWRQGRFLRGFTCGAAALAVLSFALAGPHGIADYCASLVHITSQTLTHPEFAQQHYGMSASEMPNLHGLFVLLTEAPSHSPTSFALAYALTAISSILVLVRAARQRPSLAVALPAAMLVSYHLQPYDLTLLILPLAITLTSSRPQSVDAPPGPVDQPQVAAKATMITLLILTIPIAPLLLMHGLSALSVVAVFATMWAAHHPHRLQQARRLEHGRRNRLTSATPASLQS